LVLVVVVAPSRRPLSKEKNLTDRRVKKKI